MRARACVEVTEGNGGAERGTERGEGGKMRHRYPEGWKGRHKEVRAEMGDNKEYVLSSIEKLTSRS